MYDDITSYSELDSQLPFPLFISFSYHKILSLINTSIYAHELKESFIFGFKSPSHKKTGSFLETWA